MLWCAVDTKRALASLLFSSQAATMAQHVGFGSHLHLHQTPLFTTTSITESSSTTLSLPPCFPFTFPSSSISIPRSSLIPLRHEEGEGLLQDVDSVVVVSSLQPICSEDHFNRVLAQSQHALLVVWMANWCRKCIYLKPKLEKLAVDYYPSVDVNAVSHKLVARAGVTKMPTIQLWKDSKKQAEVIGGNKAYLVINEVQEMIENECTM